MREQVWELRKEWDQRLGEVGIEDFPDVVRRARDITRQQPEPRYRVAIVDESQDLTLVGLQFIRALVSGADGTDRPDALFIVGNGAQKIDPGGFTLAQAGVDVRGNSTVLRVNYRNTREIVDAAMACTGSELVDDLGDEYTRGELMHRRCGEVESSHALSGRRNSVTKLHMLSKKFSNSANPKMSDMATLESLPRLTVKSNKHSKDLGAHNSVFRNSRIWKAAPTT